LPVFLAAGHSGAPKNFKFSRVEENLLQEVEAVDQQLETRGLVFHDPALEAYLARVARPIVDSAGTPERVQWKFRVLRDPSVNAFALPNGSVYVHTGLLAALQNDAQLAAVLAHEITHVTNRHAYEHLRNYRHKVVTMRVISAAVAAAPVSLLAGAALTVLSQGTGIILMLTVSGYSRDLEREADAFAVERMVTAGYDPEQVPKSLQRLNEKLEVEFVPLFYRDHPKLEERIEYTTALAKGRAATATLTSTDSSYLAAVEKAVQFNVQADIDSRRFRTAVVRAQRLADFRPQDAFNTFLLAEAYRALGARTAQPGEHELTRGGKAEARKMFVKRTPQEEQTELLGRPDGPKVLHDNQKMAEELYRKAQDANPAFAPTYRGLGSLYEEQGKTEPARAAYRRYLELVPHGPDRLRVQRRADALARGGGEHRYDQPMRKILLLPAHVEVVRSGVKGSEGMTRESERIAEKITALLTEQLTANHVAVLSNPFTQEALEHNQEMRAALTRIQSKYDTLSVQLHANPKMVHEGRYSLGDEVATLGPAADADTILFVRANGVVPTGGKKAFRFFVSHLPAFTTIHAYFSFADSRTGDIVAMLKLFRLGEFEQDPGKVLGKSLADSLKKLPLPGS
jgi:predicted Zn-dependent protease